MLLQFQFYLDAPEGHRMGGETILYGCTTLDMAVGHAETMLKDHSFPFGKANLCIIKDQDGHVIPEVRANRSR